MELIRQLWRGDVSLPRTYWIFYVLVGVLFTITWAVIESNFTQWFKYVGQIPVYLYLFLAITYFSFIYVAIWRSANKYKGSGVWSALAKVITVIGFIVLLASLVNIFLRPTNTVESELQETALFLNKSLPVMVDDITRLNSVTAEGKQLIYHYQITDRNSFLADADTFTSKMRPRLVNQVCDSEDMREILQKGVTFTYRYSGHNDALITTIQVTPTDCRR